MTAPARPATTIRIFIATKTPATATIAVATSALRCLRSEMDSGQIRKVWRQLLAAGKGAARVAWESARK